MTDVLTPVRTEVRLTISGSVGSGGANASVDVETVQKLLNGTSSHHGLAPLLVPDGKCGPLTRSAIGQFQRRAVGMSNPDSRVDPGGKTLRKLVELLGVAGNDVPVSAPAVIVPPVDGTLMHRLQKFFDHARTTWGIVVTANSQFRTSQVQNQFHIAHMIRFNSYGEMLRPRHSERYQGRNVISMAYLSDATVRWGEGIDYSMFLRDRLGQLCRKTPDLRGWINPPDETQTRKRAEDLLRQWKIGTPKKPPGAPAHSAQAAPGVQGCMEPCMCGGRRSKHVVGMAADLDSNAMAEIQRRLIPSNCETMNALLAQFGLHRPVSSEDWHVEAMR
jgi:hypothetical protein